MEYAFYKTLRDFYDEVEPNLRLHSPEAGFGSHWRLYPWPYPWRVSYVKNTGEIYAIHLSRLYAEHSQGPLLIIGQVDPDPVVNEATDLYYRTLNEVLKGYPDACTADEPDSLRWVTDKLRAHRASKQAG